MAQRINVYQQDNYLPLTGAEAVAANTSFQRDGSSQELLAWGDQPQVLDFGRYYDPANFAEMDKNLISELIRSPR